LNTGILFVAPCDIAGSANMSNNVAGCVRDLLVECAYWQVLCFQQRPVMNWLFQQYRLVITLASPAYM